MNLDSIWNLVQAVLGIGLVIFVHEAGHFMAARWCKVRVEVFSLGFGPKLFSWKRGGTEYQIAAVPLGGYVKMAGEDIYDPDATKQPDDLGSKSVPQRFLIYSGGVIMNMVFALIVFPIILMIGVPFHQPMIAPIQGGPAWAAGLENGTVIEEIEGKEIYAFMHISGAIALSDAGELEMLVREPGATESRKVSVTPIKSEALGLYVIEVTPAADPENHILVAKDSAAEKAGLKTGDRLLSIESAYPELPLVEQLRLTEADGGPLHAVIVNDANEERTVTIERAPFEQTTRDLLGFAPIANQVRRIRDSDLTKKLALETDELILSIHSGSSKEGQESHLLLRNGDLTRHLLAANGPISFVIQGSEGDRTVDLGVLDRQTVLQLASDIALKNNLESSRVYVISGSAAEKAGVLSGDEIVDIDGSEIAAFADITPASKPAADEKRALTLLLLRPRAGAAPEELRLEFAAAPPTPLTYGLGLQSAEYIYQAAGPIEAVKTGFVSSWRLIEDSFLTLRGILVTNSIPGESLGGIITIGVVANSWANAGLAKLFFFLCLLSVNLAFINVLPIPVLDGGHLTFLLIEGIKGSPVSEKVMGYSQLVGLVMIVSLMIYVIKNDIVRYIL